MHSSQKETKSPKLQNQRKANYKTKEREKERESKKGRRNELRTIECSKLMRSAVSGFKQTNLHDTFLMKKKPPNVLTQATKM